MKTPKSTTRRSSGKTPIPARCAGWMLRHPGVTAMPAVFGTSVIELGAVTTGSAVAGLVGAGLSWRYLHKDSYMAVASPRLRAVRRRWTRYIGKSWKESLEYCNLVGQDRRTGELLVPRLLRVAAPTPSIDVLKVKFVKGQSLRVFQDVQDELAAALGADVIAIEKGSKPRILTITLVHGNPFDVVIPPADIPGEVDEVDLKAIELGDTEQGEIWAEPLLGHHWLISGATGSGKGSLLWNPLRAMGPMIREQIARIWMIDPKGGMETERGKPLFYRHATSADDDVEYDDGTGPEDVDPMLAVLLEFRDRMRERQAFLREHKLRKFTPSVETPFEVLMIDELAMLTALGGSRSTISQVNRILAEILTQGRAAGFAVVAYVQEPTKDIVPVRDLFTRRISLRTGSASYVDMVLGEDARLRGALADEIPEEGCEGIGYRTSEKSRTPIRVRAGYSTDDDIDELVRLCTPHFDDDGPAGIVVPFAA
ncbi:type IV secretory system conjugative DNA transfer family protein [Amycolatopsis keratiniphila]|uniref:Cell division FtsK/SpoIIIE n=1 Tax=Amycolatopsis keratiniphila TaxID=129921 RepID=R4T1S4_9PSEU|nr:FtsK/SpoIIIE domain-containing protein [Amycolatopsis keratiniphila]AGM09554.1 cell division FtsK/SpoIIIE [Amycolatopsis keratiniphila]